MAADDDLLAQIAAITSTTTEAELLTAMKVVARSLGYDHTLFGIEVRLPGATPSHHITSGFPDDYMRLYGERNFIMRDPAVAHCRTQVEPIVWEERIYNLQSFEIFEETRRFHLGDGASFPVNVAGRLVGMFSLGRDRPFTSAAERRMVLNAGKCIAPAVLVASERLIVPGVLERRRPKLSPRERACLQLVAIGKTNAEIGDILNISEHTAAVYVKTMMRKFGVSTRGQAVAVGVALGLVS